MKRSVNFTFFVPIIVVLVFGAANFLESYRTAEKRVYDTLLHVKPSVEEHPDILLVDVDDLAIEKVGVWPWSRNIMGDGLVVMKEMGAKYVVFDIEYTEESPRGVDSRYLEMDLPSRFADEFAFINENIEGLFGAIASGQLSATDAQDFVGDLLNLNESARTGLLNAVRQVARNNDKVLGDGAAFFGKAFTQ